MARHEQNRRVVDRDGEKVIEITRTRRIGAQELQQRLDRIDQAIERARKQHIEPLEKQKAELEQDLAELNEQE